MKKQSFSIKQKCALVPHHFLLNVHIRACEWSLEVVDATGVRQLVSVWLCAGVVGKRARPSLSSETDSH